MNIRSSIVLSESKNLTYAMDLEDTSSQVFRFEGAAAFFIKNLINKKPHEDILREALENFSDCNEEEVRKDFSRFLRNLEELGFFQKK